MPRFSLSLRGSLIGSRQKSPIISFWERIDFRVLILCLIFKVATLGLIPLDMSYINTNLAQQDSQITRNIFGYVHTQHRYQLDPQQDVGDDRRREMKWVGIGANNFNSNGLVIIVKWKSADKMNENKCTNQHYKLFQSQLQCILAHVTKQLLTFQQLYLIYYQSNIKFSSQQEQDKFKQLFSSHNNLLSLRQCLSLTQLHSCHIIHNRPLFYVVIAHPETHQEKECFGFWKQVMATKFGSQIKWFDMIAGQIQARKIKSIDFKTKIKQILRATAHEDCCQKICRKFPKNKRNQIEWSTFMAVIRYIDGRYANKANTVLSQLSQQRQQTVQKIKEEVQKNKPMRRTRRPSHYLYSRQSQRIKEQKNQKNKANSSYNQYDMTSCGNEDDQFQMKSSLEIDKEYRAITRKFNHFDNQENMRIVRSRAKSAKNTTSIRVSIGTCTSVNWRQAKNGRENINLVQPRYENSFPSQKFSTSHYPSTNSGQGRLRNNYFSTHAKPKFKLATEPICIEDRF